MYRAYRLITLSALAVGTAAASISRSLAEPTKTPIFAGWTQPGPRYNPNRPSTSIAAEPHLHSREIARRERQRHRLHAKYMLNGGFSRRGNEVGPIAA